MRLVSSLSSPLPAATAAAGQAPDSDTGTDTDGNGSLNSDFGSHLLPQFSQGFPGPSGLPCAGNVP